MFLTFEHAESPVGALVRGGHMWRYVEYLTEHPWFYVTLLEPDGDSVRRAVYLIPLLEDLLELAQAGDQGWSILQVFMVSPGGLNGSGNWKMDELIEITRAYVPERQYLIYSVHPEVDYFEGDLTHEVSEIETEVIFSLRDSDSVRQRPSA